MVRKKDDLVEVRSASYVMEGVEHQTINQVVVMGGTHTDQRTIRSGIMFRSYAQTLA
jgi:hypothetical protein